MGVPVLEVKNLSKSFGKKLVINNVSFTIHEGEIFGLLGPSFSGKSAIMRAICGSLVPKNGDIIVNTYSYKNNYSKAMQYISGYITSPKMYRNMTGLQNVAMFSQLRGNYSNNDILEVFRIVGIEHLANTKLKNYSIADRQKLYLANSMITNPKIIVLDDPFLGMKLKEVQEQQNLIRTLAKKYHIAFVLSSQVLGQIEELCDTIAIVNNGGILETRSIDSIRQLGAKDDKLAFTVDYPNFAGKIIINEMGLKVALCGNKILVYTTKENEQKIAKRLTDYKINIFRVEVISRPLAELLDEILQRKAMNKSWVEEYN